MVRQIIKPMLTLQTYKNLNWSHQAIYTLLRSATNIFIIQMLGEFYDSKSNMLENEENIIGNIQGNTTEERPFKIVKWFIHNEASTSPIRLTSFNLDVSSKIKEREKC